MILRTSGGQQKRTCLLVLVVGVTQRFMQLVGKDLEMLDDLIGLAEADLRRQNKC